MTFSFSRDAMSFFIALCIATGICSAATAGKALSKDRRSMQSVKLSEPFDPNKIDGWAADDHSAALSAFVAHCKESGAQTQKTKASGVADAHLRMICAKALKSPAVHAKSFLEQNFTFHHVIDDGFVTGYYMPELAGSLIRTGEYTTPLHRYPDNLKVMPTRGEVMDGALDGMGLEILWVKDPVDAFFTAIQGSARVRLPNGELRRLAFAGKSGHDYSAIGRLLIARGAISTENMGMDALRTWLSNNPSQRDDVFRHNKSYIFFELQSPQTSEVTAVGGAGTGLTDLRSLAIDDDLHTYGSLIFVSSDLRGYDKSGDHFARLMVAQDTGSAIKGAARGDIYVGSGAEAGAIAGNIRHRADFYLLVPK
ncbi:Membrane-bound lytic murein transglycosylase A precursor [Pseudovibrio axinellae]|uniref:peptidoglycan lytic exotransglycosylase n=1 Tax=Pseudovibrio axinellae TaxID=989403 RepID=A0A165Z2W5_9HYPH|nr:MltA domain-containing protein [Pseudovibrio axinellae]KZL19466.1 Membrane-bound lytic murein transglycosylase A precursor [Pseudovibrio axinellae]SEQ27859.1 membrane-bound lytic murein transglycosylase A [Pseudovibrio axinellae]